ncbi:hypothetical protein CFP56_004860 [Quercus suber]|uniref:Uncharacterized protein n=1 Tax=Quercus suber TaxID=58331 RepID=A0AAW0MA69_QUESU
MARRIVSSTASTRLPEYAAINNSKMVWRSSKQEQPSSEHKRNVPKDLPSSPTRVEPKVMQSGHLVVEILNFSNNDKVKRVATDHPREFLMIISGLELSICIMI